MSAIAFCGALGRSNADKSLRIYSQEECELALNGEWMANGECVKKGEGSWSWDCRYLNAFPDPAPSPAPGARNKAKAAAAAAAADTDDAAPNHTMMYVVGGAAVVAAYMYLKRK